MSNCFSHPKGWNCWEELCLKYPRNLNESQIFRICVEEQNKRIDAKGVTTSSLDDYSDKLIPSLAWDLPTWKSNIKVVDTQELREWLKLINKRKNLVEEEVYKRTL